MIPRPGTALANLAGKLAELAPETTSAYAMANTGMIAMLLGALALDAERAAAARMTDIAELELLFRRAGDAPGAEVRAAFCGKEPASLHLADLDPLHAEGLDLLIALHAWAEDADPDLDAEIWAFLDRHAERHKLEP